MSQIRKPVGAERASPLRRAADATIDTAQDLKAGARASGRLAQRVLVTVASVWLLGTFTFGALSASSPGATLLGLLLISPLYYLAYLAWRRMAA